MFPSRFIKTILSGSGQLVELGCHRGLLVGCVVLVQQALRGRAVDCLNSNFIGIDGIILVALGNSCVKLLHHGLELGLVSTVLGSEFLGLQVSLCRRFNVGHVSIATSSYKIELHNFNSRLVIIAKNILKIKHFFKFFFAFFEASSIVSKMGNTTQDIDFGEW